MKRLPSELLGEIFFQLHQHDQMECMLVCHRWQQIIEELVLYNTVYIYSRESFNKLTEKIQQKSEVAGKIDRLILCIGYFDDDESYMPFAREMHAFLCLLHHLQALSYHLFLDEETYANETKGTTPYPWLKYIQHMSEQSFSTLASQLLSSTLCLSLTTLEIGEFDNKSIDILKNTPALKTLIIRSSTISINKLELLHTYLPHLISITLDNLSLESFEINLDIIPATNMTECNFNGSQLFKFELHIQVLVYISKKYPNLSALSYNYTYEHPCHDDIKKLVDYGWIPLLQVLECQLKKICLSRWELIYSNLFDVLDRLHCQINYLYLYDVTDDALSKLAQSQQVLYIQTLVMKDVEFEASDWLKEFRQLTNLKLMGCGVNDPSEAMCFNMNDLIDHFPPTLRSLYIDRANLVLDFEYTGISYIETLSLQWMMSLPEKTDLFISHHFPRLSTLILSIPTQRGITFDLSTMDLYRIYLTSFNYFNECYYIMMSNNNIRRWYSKTGQIRKTRFTDTLDDLHTFHYVPFKTWPEDELNQKVDFTLICNSVKSLIFAE